MKNQKVVIPNSKFSEVIPLEEIVVCVSNGSYSEIMLKNDKKVVVSKNLRWCEENISNDQFFRTHRSYLVNLTYIYRFFQSDNTISLKNGLNVPLSRSKKQEFLQKLKAL